MNELVSIPTKGSPATIVYIALVAVAVLMAVVFSYYREQSLKIISAAFSTRKKGALNRTDSEMVAKVGRYLSLMFFVNLLLFLYAVRFRYSDSLNISSNEFLILSGLVLGFFIVKQGIHYALAVVFKTQDFASLYLEDSNIKYRLFGVVLFPLILMLLFSQSLYHFALIVGIAGFSLIWLLKSYFGLKLGLVAKSFPKHYSFLYICTLEILPLALLCKIFMGPINSLLS